MKHPIMNNHNILLKAEKEFNIRFSEVDSMNIVWHGDNSMYFEGVIEAF